MVYFLISGRWVSMIYEGGLFHLREGYLTVSIGWQREGTTAVFLLQFISYARTIWLGVTLKDAYGR